MTPAELISTLDTQGVTVAFDGGCLRLRGPASAVTDDLRRLVAQHRMRLIAHLAGSACNICGQPCHPDFNPHPTCGPEEA